MTPATNKPMKQINNDLRNEVLDFLGKEFGKENIKIRCQCGEPFQREGYLCFACGEVVKA